MAKARRTPKETQRPPGGLVMVEEGVEKGSKTGILKKGIER